MHTRYVLLCAALSISGLINAFAKDNLSSSRSAIIHAAAWDANALFINDAAPTEIIAPISYGGSSSSIYPSGFPIKPEGRFVNRGSASLQNVAVGYSVIDDADGKVVYTGHDVLIGSLAPGEVRDLLFINGFTPIEQGTYYIKIFTLLPNDENRSNDTLDFASRGRSFLVRFQNELQLKSLNSLGLVPQNRGIYPRDPITIHLPMINAGYTDATNIPALALIRREDCFSVAPIYAQTVTVPLLPGNDTGSGPVVLVQFPPFTPPQPGHYCVTVQVFNDWSTVRYNDTARWTFDVVDLSAVPNTITADRSTASHVLTLWPNPARERTTIDVQLPKEMPATLKLYDEGGRVVRVLMDEKVLEKMSLELNTADLASGIYTIRLTGINGIERTERLVIAH